MAVYLKANRRPVLCRAAARFLYQTKRLCAWDGGVQGASLQRLQGFKQFVRGTIGRVRSRDQYVIGVA